MTVNVVQYDNPRYDDQHPEATDRYVYQVKSLCNRVEPAVGTFLGVSAVRDLIDGGTEVNVTH